VIAGPTGTGKSDLALRLAETAGGEIVNYDSIQAYRGFDIGSAKPSAQARARVPHHLYDILDADAEFNAAEYARRAAEVCEQIAGRGRIPILVGGTFFYLRALLAGLPEMPARDEALRDRIRRVAARPRGGQWLHRWLTKVDPRTAAAVPPADRHRVERALEVWSITGQPISAWERPTSKTAEEIPSIKIALFRERQQLIKDLEARVERMYAEGLVEETRGLLERYPRTARPFGAIGYREAAGVVAGEITVEQASRETKRRTRSYAKRQMTWLRSERNVHWVNSADREAAFIAAQRLIEGES
jgi:tRNA dimethylallyltransferase